MNNKDSYTCRICKQKTAIDAYTVREMQIGLKSLFTYQECTACSCIQIKDYPKNIGEYYPPNYYSFNKKRKIEDSGLKFELRKKIAAYLLHGGTKIGLASLLHRIFGGGFIDYLKSTQLNFNSSVLDVGTGSGFRLLQMHKYGFTNLYGCDPFNEEEYSYKDEIKLTAESVYDVRGTFDFIMLNHVLEHMPDQHKVINQLSKLLAPGGLLLIRIPISTCYGIRRFRENCVSFDAPRHFYLHSPFSLIELTKNLPLRLTKTYYDSTAAQFWGSLQYERDIPKMADDSYYISKEKSIFSKKEITFFSEEAQRLNQKNDGNIASFYFRKDK